MQSPYQAYGSCDPIETETLSGLSRKFTSTNLDRSHVNLHLNHTSQAEWEMQV